MSANMSRPEAAYILFGHGARDAAWARPLERLAIAVRTQDPHADVRIAFLEFMSPTLTEAVEEAIAAGAGHVVIVPVFLAQGGHVRRDVPVMLDALRARHDSVTIELREALGEAGAVIDAMAGVILHP